MDPSDPRKIHTVNYSYFLSNNSGGTFNGGVSPQTPVLGWDKPQMAVDAAGVVHYAAASGGDNSEIFYRRIAPPPPGTTDKALTLVADGSRTRFDNMQASADARLNFTTAMTLEFWARLESDDMNDVYFEPLVGKTRPSTEASYGIGAWDGQAYARLVTDKTDARWGSFIGSGVSMEKGKWYHLAMTYDASLTADNFKLFVNGALCGKCDLQGSILTATMDSKLLIGNSYTTARGGFSIDELRLWNRALTQSSIVTGISTSLKGTERGLVAYYNFNGTTKDITGHGHDGTLMFRERFTKPGPMTLLKPEIGVQQPIGSNLVDGTAKRSFGTVKTGKTGTAKTFTIKNPGTATLTGLAITKNGAHASNFIVTRPAKTKLAPGASTTFKVSFKPTATGTRNAAIHIKNNDSNENPFDIQLTGLGVKP